MVVMSTPGEGEIQFSGSPRLQLVAKGEGEEHANTFCMSLRKVKLGEGKSFPSENNINIFLKENLALDVKKISCVSHSRTRKCTTISFINEEDVIKFEEIILTGRVPWSRGYY